MINNRNSFARSSFPRNDSPKQGFTLIELIIVIIIMAIITSITLPAFLKKEAASNSTKATQAVVQIITSAQRAAIDRGSPVTLIIDPVSQRYEATAANSDTAIASGTIELPGGTILRSDSLRVKFLFRSDGTADTDYLFVQSDNDMARIDVDRWSGGARVVR